MHHVPGVACVLHPHHPPPPPRIQQQQTKKTSCATCVCGCVHIFPSSSSSFLSPEPPDKMAIAGALLAVVLMVAYIWNEFQKVRPGTYKPFFIVSVWISSPSVYVVGRERQRDCSGEGECYARVCCLGRGTTCCASSPQRVWLSLDDAIHPHTLGLLFITRKYPKPTLFSFPPLCLQRKQKTGDHKPLSERPTAKRLFRNARVKRNNSTGSNSSTGSRSSNGSRSNSVDIEEWDVIVVGAGVAGGAMGAAISRNYLSGGWTKQREMRVLILERSLVRELELPTLPIFHARHHVRMRPCH